MSDLLKGIKQYIIDNNIATGYDIFLEHMPESNEGKLIMMRLSPTNPPIGYNPSYENQDFNLFVRGPKNEIGEVVDKAIALKNALHNLSTTLPRTNVDLILCKAVSTPSLDYIDDGDRYIYIVPFETKFNI